MTARAHISINNMFEMKSRTKQLSWKIDDVVFSRPHHSDHRFQASSKGWR